MINQVTLVGNLTADPRLKSTGTTDVLEFSVAVNEPKKNQDGNWINVPNYFDITVFGNQATHLSNNIFKGSKVALIGRLKYDSWNTEEGKRSKVYVIASNVEYMTSKELVSESPTKAPEPIQESLYDSEVPF